MMKIKNFLDSASIWLDEEIAYWRIDFWNTVLKFVLNHNHHIYVSNIYKVLDSTNKYEMKHYVELWKQERGL